MNAQFFKVRNLKLTKTFYMVQKTLTKGGTVVALGIGTHIAKFDLYMSSGSRIRNRSTKRSNLFRRVKSATGMASSQYASK